MGYLFFNHVIFNEAISRLTAILLLQLCIATISKVLVAEVHKPNLYDCFVPLICRRRVSPDCCPSNTKVHLLHTAELAPRKETLSFQITTLVYRPATEVPLTHPSED